MSDHVDGPRSIDDPSADLTDLFAFTSPTQPNRFVIIANVFPSAGATALFSNAIEYHVAIRPVQVAGRGDGTKFAAGAIERRFIFRFAALPAASDSRQHTQSGTCTLPDQSSLTVTVNDTRGAQTADNAVRVFAGLRSDPFVLAWNFAQMQPLPNLLQHDNVLTLVIEFETTRVLDLGDGTLFGVIAETKPIPRTAGVLGAVPLRVDTVGRPEQTNMRFNNPGLGSVSDVRDIWNQQDLFAIDPHARPLFRERMIASLENWDMKDGSRAWSPAALAACADVFLDDFLLFDVAKPFSDQSFFEIEKSTLEGRSHSTGGGRTIGVDVIDVLLNWMVSRDRGPRLQGGATVATKPGSTSFPYLAAPNDTPQSVSDSIDITAPPDVVWAVVGDFSLKWHPLVSDVAITGSGIGRIRTLETIDGKTIIERLESIDHVGRSYVYAMLAGVPAAQYAGTLSVQAAPAGSSVRWTVDFTADGQPTLTVRTIVSTLIRTGLNAVQKRFSAVR